MSITLEYQEGTPLRDRIRQAVKEQDAATVGRIVTDLRDRGFKYSATFRLVSNITGISSADWDELLYQADHLDGRT